MSKIEFTKHAKYQLKARYISKAEVFSVLAKPDKVILQSNLRKKALKLFHKNGRMYLLIVIYEEVYGKITIVTALITSKLKKYS